MHVNYLTTPFSNENPSYFPFSVSLWDFIFSPSPLRLIPDMKHLFKRHEAQFFLRSLSMVQSFRLAHRWFCLPGGTERFRGDEVAFSTMIRLPLIVLICGCLLITWNNSPSCKVTLPCLNAPTSGRKKLNQREWLCVSLCALVCLNWCSTHLQRLSWRILCSCRRWRLRSDNLRHRRCKPDTLSCPTDTHLGTNPHAWTHKT